MTLSMTVPRFESAGFANHTLSGSVQFAFSPPGQRERIRDKTHLRLPSDSFRNVADEWMVKNKREGRAPVTLDKMRWLLAKADPFIGAKPIRQIMPTDLLPVLRSIEGRGHYESARRMRSVLSRVFRYAIATGQADRDVACDLRGALISPKVRHRAAITDPEEVGALLRAIDGYSGQPTTANALRLAPHLFARPGELRMAEWHEFDMRSGVWCLPAEKMKMGRPHKVPLSRQVISILEDLDGLNRQSKYLFPSLRGPEQCMCENTLNLALRRLGYMPDEMTAHGFRAMAASLLNEMSLWNPDAIERQLAHQEANTVRRAYARAEFWDERVRMMQHWSDYLDQLRNAPGITVGRRGQKRGKDI